MRRKKKRFNKFFSFFKHKSNDDKVTFKEKLVLRIVSLIITVILAIILLGGFTLFKIKSESMPAASNTSFGDPVNILLLGMDIGDPNQENNDSIKRTDTIMLLNYHPKTNSMKIVSIPRDTLITVNKNSVKINAAFAIGGYTKIKSEVEKLLNININYLVKIDYNAFREVIDSIGGVEMTIERDMIYDDEGQNLHINFKAGETVNLDGEKAEQFFRWRKNNDGTGFANGDLDRIQNQQKFISKVIDKCTSPIILFRLPSITMAIADNVETNMPAWKILSYGFRFIGLNKEKLSMTTAAGTPKTINGQSFLVFDKNVNKELISSLGSSGEPSTGISKDDVRIKVLNATKVTGLAGEVKGILNNLGYENVDTGNHVEICEKSEILCNNKSMRNNIKSLTGIKNVDEKPSKAEYDNYDVIIIIGKDYKKFGS